MQFRRPTVFFGVLVAFLACSNSSVFAASPVTVSNLTNGLRVLTAPNHAVALAAIDIWVRAGSSRQAAGETGVAHYLEHVLFKGTLLRPDESAVDGAIEDLGGSLNATTSFDWAHFYVVVPSANFESALSVMADTIQHATITSDSVESERPIIENEIARQQDDTSETMIDSLRKLTYGDNHPYNGPVTGTPADVQAVTRDQIANFYKKFYVPNNATLIVTGNVNPDQVKTAATAAFGSWQFSADLPDLATPPKIVPDGIQRTVIKRGVGESYMTLGFFAPTVKDQPDTWVMDILLTMLGQGGNNRLDKALHQDQKIVDSISADYLTQRNQGLLTITCSFPTGTAPLVEAAILDQIQRLRDQPVSNDELEGAKQALAASYFFDVQTDSGRADALGFYDMIDTYQYDVDYMRNCRAVSASQVQAIAQTYLTPDKYSIVTLLPYTDATFASSATNSSSAELASMGGVK